jgi:hypothetical protein
VRCALSDKSTEKRYGDNFLVTFMKQLFHIRDAEGNARSALSNQTRRRHVSYNKHEAYIQELEDKLCQQYRCGYSALHKKLILDKGSALLNIGMF